MTDLDDIYSNKIMELAASISNTKRLSLPDATASAYSKLCGSKIEVDITMEQGRITAFGQDVKACLLGQVAASVVGREIVGTKASEISAVGETMREMLKNDGPAPDGRWVDLAILQPVKDYHTRHASTLLVFDALEDAIAIVEKKKGL